MLTFASAMLISCKKEVSPTNTHDENKGNPAAHPAFDNRQYPWQITTYSNFNEAYKRQNKQGC